MTFSEKTLYHQIHPIKLFTDIATAALTLVLFWYHYFWLALILHVLLPILGSYVVITYVNLEKQKKSAFGKYIRTYMTRMITLLRLGGDIVALFGAWYHVFALVGIGILIIFMAWNNGNMRPTIT